MSTLHTTTPSRAQWFAAQVWAGREQLCERHLCARGYQVFLPRCQEVRRWSDRAKKVERALFPGYVFCHVSGSEVGRIVTTPGVIRIVSVAGQPGAVPDAEVDAIRRIVEARLACEPWDFLAAGQRVRVETGPLRDVEGIVVSLRSHRRLVVSVSVLHRAVAVDIDASWVRALPSHDGATIASAG